MGISHVTWRGTERWVTSQNEGFALLPLALCDLLELEVSEARDIIGSAAEVVDSDAVMMLPPVDVQDVWGAGVTYRRSRDGRAEESKDPSVYDRVYSATRPEVFFKSRASQVVGDGDSVGIRADSGWDVPEPELGLVINSRGELFGFVVGNDMSSRSIEGENPLYLPQAKVYDRSCALGSVIIPVWDAPPGDFAISMSIERAGARVFEGETSTASLVRPFGELIDWLVRAASFPGGVVLLTGTGIVPDANFTLHERDVVSIDIGGIGSLANPVVTVGRGAQDRVGSNG